MAKEHLAVIELSKLSGGETTLEEVRKKGQATQLPAPMTPEAFRSSEPAARIERRRAT